jgi:hypothetical protein
LHRPAVSRRTRKRSDVHNADDGVAAEAVSEVVAGEHDK